ncbi:hypothetical protein AGMMS4956_14470 [Bacteroidia bacterium]|nr:hypothetical protein AGMMS4956_14470 [Bacteroidia bacterium]
MALEIKRGPVLRGKAAVDFYKTWENMTESRSKEDIQATFEKWRLFISKQKNLKIYYK